MRCRFQLRATDAGGAGDVERPIQRVYGFGRRMNYELCLVGDDNQEPNYANRWGRLVASDRLRGVTKHARRLVKIDLVPVSSAEISVPKERDLDAATHDATGIDHRCSRGRRDGDFRRTAGTLRRDGDFGRAFGTRRFYGQFGALTCRQERDRAARHAWGAYQ